MKKRLLKAVVRSGVSSWKLFDYDDKKSQIKAVTPFNYLYKFATSRLELTVGDVSLAVKVLGSFKGMGFLFEKDEKLFKAEINNGVASFVEFTGINTPFVIIEQGNTIEELNSIKSFAEKGNVVLVVGCSFKHNPPELSFTLSNKQVVDIDDPTVPVKENDPDRVFVVSGTASEGITINGKGAELTDVVLTSDSRLRADASEHVKMSNMKVQGSFTKSKGNSQTIINASSIDIADSSFEATGYNAVECGMWSKPTEINIENIVFSGKLQNNAISIFDTAENAVVNIKNCVFEDVSNPVRISNNSNAKVTYNFIDCTVKSWDSRPEYYGLMIFQDYTSKSAEDSRKNNMFGPDKVTVNIVNCITPKGKLQPVEDLATVCGTKDENQLFYMYSDREGEIAYSVDRFPIITIK